MKKIIQGSIISIKYRSRFIFLTHSRLCRFVIETSVSCNSLGAAGFWKTEAAAPRNGIADPAQAQCLKLCQLSLLQNIFHAVIPGLLY